MDASTLWRWGLLAAVLAWAVWVYNRLVRLRNEITNAFAQIDVQLKRRHDLIPNLVEAARKYVEHESDTFEAVARARNSAVAAADAARRDPSDAAGIMALGAADSALGAMLGRLMAVVEAYPVLKADGTLRDLSEELAHTENRVAFARQAFNDAVLDYNNAAQQFPALLLARLAGFREAATLQVIAEPREREAAKVAF